MESAVRAWLLPRLASVIVSATTGCLQQASLATPISAATTVNHSAIEETSEGLRRPQSSPPLSGIQVCQRLEESPAWAVDYGKEFWRYPETSINGSASIENEAGKHRQLPKAVDLDDAISRVVHAFTTNASEPLPQVRAATYSARIHEDGLHFTRNGADWRDDEAAGTTTFRTLSIRRGSQFAFAPGQVRLASAVLGNTCQALLQLSSGLVEHYEARASDVSITWVMQRPPAGTGPLHVKAELKGLVFAGETCTGLLFEDNLGDSWRVGRVTAVDSVGRKWNVSMTATGSRLDIEVPEEVLVTAQFPLAIDPTVGPEFPIGDPVVGPKTGDQYNPAVAGSSNIFLVGSPGTELEFAL